jgi:hypothetical protein
MIGNPLVHQTTVFSRQAWVDPRTQKHLYYSQADENSYLYSRQVLVSDHLRRDDVFLHHPMRQVEDSLWNRMVAVNDMRFNPPAMKNLFKLAERDMKEQVNVLYPGASVSDRENEWAKPFYANSFTELVSGPRIVLTANTMELNLPTKEQVLSARTIAKEALRRLKLLFGYTAIYENFFKAKNKRPLDETAQTYYEDYPYTTLGDSARFMGGSLVRIHGFDDNNWLCSDCDDSFRIPMLDLSSNFYGRRTGFEMVTQHFVPGVVNNDGSSDGRVTALPHQYELCGYFILPLYNRAKPEDFPTPGSIKPLNFSDKNSVCLIQ